MSSCKIKIEDSAGGSTEPSLVKVIRHRTSLFHAGVSFKFPT